MAGQISKRTKLIIDLLVQQKDFVSGSWIAKQLGVSKRTVLREMDEVERQVRENGAVLERVPGKGVKIELPLESAGEFLLQMNNTSVEEHFNPEERQRSLIIELIGSKEIQKLYYFASKFKISEATVSNDLDRIEPWLKSRNLKLIRKPGYGVRVEGHETDIRKTIVELVYDNFSRDELMDFLRKQYSDTPFAGLRTDIKKRLLNIIGDSTLHGIESAIESSGILRAYALADNAYVALVVHLSLAVQRILAGEKIHFDPVLLDELKESTEYGMAEKLINVTSDNLNISIPTDEIGYVTMHLQGAKFRSTKDKDASFRIHDYEIIHLAEQLVQIVERKAGMILSDNKRLLTDLVNHMGPALTRIRMGMIIRNPLLEQIKTQYMTYYKWTEEAVVDIEERLGNKIPEDEIGYLTMHFGAAIESSIKRRNLVWRVIIACSTGIGSSKLLESRVGKLYKNIKIVSVRSTLSIEKAIQDEDVDFVISTVRLKQTLVPTVVVSPLLLDEDAKRIEEMLSAIKPKHVQKTDGKEQGLVSILAQLNMFSAAGESVLQHYFHTSTSGVSEEQIIEDAASIIKTTDRNQLVRDLKKREDLGRTPIGNEGILLHCRTKAVDFEQFGFLRVESTGLGLSYVVVMVVPEKVSEVSRSLLGTLTQKVVELDNWVQEVKEGSFEKSYATLEQIISEELKAMLQILEDTNE